MKKILYLLCLGLIVCVVCNFALPDVTYAAPGGMIVKAATKTWYGKAIVIILTIIFLPLLLYIMVKEKVASNRASKALTELAKINNIFRWTVLNQRAYEVITHVYYAWKKSDVSQATEWMTDWYWQNQKITVLDEWESEGLSNYCKLNKILSVKPLYVEYNEKTTGDGEGSRVVLLVKVKLIDYLINDKTGEVVEGDKKNKNFESVWTLLLEEGQWKLTLIEEGALSLRYAKMKSDIEGANQHLKAGGDSTCSKADLNIKTD
ncbi:Hypothetical protein LUCI_1362 [Lucifera butyrica]|uniref:Tim44-like domain-containing protein n=1 Tax=Lucifera butyrica TaxID=1351585 RepID=A0A498R5N8_9FIRM|nr:TIM44-like domain-containing protein [Lucifera butyrica]VBB06147.1 Hypothetical protein LUCI_1362 [Lucifera butyrica]